MFPHRRTVLYIIQCTIINVISSGRVVYQNIVRIFLLNHHCYCVCHRTASIIVIIIIIMCTQCAFALICSPVYPFQSNLLPGIKLVLTIIITIAGDRKYQADRCARCSKHGVATALRRAV